MILVVGENDSRMHERVREPHSSATRTTHFDNQARFGCERHLLVRRKALTKRKREKRPVRSLSETRKKRWQKKKKKVLRKLPPTKKNGEKKKNEQPFLSLSSLSTSQFLSSFLLLPPCSSLLALPTLYFATIASLCLTKSSPSPLHSSSFFGAATALAALTFSLSFLAATAALCLATSSECAVT